jgi:hypothetical protein
VLAVETSGCGFLSDRRSKLLFERHIFHRLTGGRFDAEDADVSQPTAGGYGPGGAHQYDRLAAAISLDRDAALQSASWGLGQIMGMNFQAAGFDSVEDMVAAMVESEDRQLLATAKFFKRQRGMADALKNHDWKAFARIYNGPRLRGPQLRRPSRAFLSAVLRWEHARPEHLGGADLSYVQGVQPWPRGWS